MKLRNIILSAVLAFGGTLYAQTPVDHISAYFPTPVEVSGAMLPAGNVTIQVVTNNGTTFLTLRSDSGEAATALVNLYQDLTTNIPAAKVVLGQKDGTYHLEKVLLPGHTTLSVLGQ